MNIYKILIIGSILALSGCLNIKSKYPETSFYNLTQMKTETGVGVDLPGTLLIKDVKFPAQYDTQSIIEVFPDSRVEKYSYHRWVDLPSVLATDFVKTRMNMYEAYSGSIVEPGSSIYPDYSLELSFIEFEALNDGNKSTVKLSAKIVLYKKTKDSPETKTLISKVYKEKSLRQNGKISSIAPAFSELFSKVTDLIAYDVQSEILKQK